MATSPRAYKKSGTFGKRSFGAHHTKPTFGARNFGERPTELHQATCNSCHAPCEVPFRPNGKKPVYCRDCFQKQDAAPSYSRTSSATPAAAGTDQLIARIDRLIVALEAHTRAIIKQ